MPGRTVEPIQIYQIKVALSGSQPPIWRRIQVTSDITVAKLHRILQAVMGWTDAHLHRFLIQGKHYGVRDEGRIGLTKTIDEHKHELREVVPGQNFRFTYDYDFGDGWEHLLFVEEVLSPQENMRYPVCLAGARACPPEDVGGISGYEDFLEAIQNPDHPQREEYLEWIGGDFDPEGFDVAGVNRALRRLK